VNWKNGRWVRRKTGRGKTGMKAALRQNNRRRGQGERRKIRVAYSFPRKVFTIPRSAFSFRRYQRHCPSLVASTSPAFVKTAM
jgi:hypothetical protein